MLDEHPDSINDGAFAVKMDQPQIIDFAATYHNNAAGFSFADGHAEIRKWRTSQFQVKPLYGPNPAIQNTTVGWDNVDGQWLRRHTSSRKDGAPVQ
jgi:prepilin-type processing-associated H-X9-DG protein